MRKVFLNNLIKIASVSAVALAVNCQADPVFADYELRDEISVKRTMRVVVSAPNSAEADVAQRRYSNKLKIYNGNTKRLYVSISHGSQVKLLGYIQPDSNASFSIPEDFKDFDDFKVIGEIGYRFKRVRSSSCVFDRNKASRVEFRRKLIGTKARAR